MLCGYCNLALLFPLSSRPGVEPPVMLCGYCNVAFNRRDGRPLGAVEPPVMLCGYCNFALGAGL